MNKLFKFASVLLLAAVLAFPGIAYGVGKTIYVRSTTGSDAAGYGYNPNTPVATIDYAIALCTTNMGDTIVVQAGHTEDIDAAGAITIDMAGIKIIGLGNEANRPVITWSAELGDIEVDAANVTIENIHFDMTGVDSVDAAIDVDAANFVMRSCYVLIADTAGQVDTAITADANADGLMIEDTQIIGSTDVGVNMGISLPDASEGAIFRNLYIEGAFAIAGIYSSDAITGVAIDDCYVRNFTDDTYAVGFDGNGEGYIRNTSLATNAIASAFEPGSLDVYDVLWYDDDHPADSQGIAWQSPVLNRVAGTHGYDQGTDSMQAVSEKVGDNENAAASPFASATVQGDRDGSLLEREEYITALLATGAIDKVIAPADTYTILDILGSDGNDATGAVAGSILGAIGTNEAVGNTPFTSTTVGADQDGSVLEREEYIMSILRNGTPATITTPGTNLTILDVLGSDGTTTTGAAAASILGAIGTNEAAADTPFTSATAEADRDGSLIERSEFTIVGIYDAIAAAPTGKSLRDILHKDGSFNFDNTTDSLEAISDSIGSLGGLSFRGTATAGAVDSTTVPELIGFGDAYFVTDWVLIVVKDSAGLAGAPEGEIVDIDGYTSATGVFTHANVTIATDADDEIMVARRELFLVDRVSVQDVPADGSLAEYIVSGGTAHGTDLGDSNSIIDVLGSDGVDATFADALSILGAIGTNEAAADTPFTSAAVESDADGSVLEREEWIQVEMAKVPKSDSTVTWNATALQSIQDEGEDALEGENLDHLVQDAVDTNLETTVDDASVLGYVLASANVTNFDRTTDSLEAIGTDTDSIITELAKVPKSDGAVTWNATALQSIQDEAEDALEGENVDHFATTAVDTNLQTTVADTSVYGYILASANVANYDRTTDSLEAIGAVVAAVPGSGGVVSWNATALQAIQDEAEDALEGENLDHFIQDAVDTNLETTVDDASALGYLLAAANVTNYDRTTDSLEALGTSMATVVADTPYIADGALPAAPTPNSLAAYIASGGTALGTELPDSKSIVDETRGASVNYNRVGYITLSVDLTSATWNTVATHEIATVTGAVRMRILVECTETITDAGDTATIQLGTAGATDGWIAVTSAGGAGDANELNAGEIWMDATPDDDESAAYSSAMLDRLVIGSYDVGYEVLAEALTDGTLVFHMWWEPLDATGAVVVGAGGVL